MISYVLNAQEARAHYGKSEKKASSVIDVLRSGGVPVEGKGSLGIPRTRLGENADITTCGENPSLICFFNRNMPWFTLVLRYFKRGKIHRPQRSALKLLFC